MGARNRLIWTMLDQIVSSATNFGLAFLLLRSVSTSEFGAFSIVFATYLLVLIAGRSVAGTLLLMTHADSEDTSRAAGAVGTALGLGLVLCLPLLIAGLALSEPIGSALIPMALVMPGLLMQDAYRHLFIAEQQPQRALALDFVWGVLLVAGTILTRGHHDVTTLIFVWGIAGGLSAILGGFLRGVWPSRVHAVTWLREHRHLSVPFLIEAGLLRGSQWMALTAIGVWGGLALVGSINGANTLLGPMTVINMGMVTFAIPEGVRTLEDGPELLFGRLRALAAFLVLLTVALGSLVGALPTIGEGIVGDSWEQVRPYLLPVTLWVASNGVSHAARAGLRIYSAPKYSLTAQSIAAGLLVVITVIAVNGLGGTAVAYGLAIAGWLGAGAWWILLAMVTKRTTITTPSTARPGT